MKFLHSRSFLIIIGVLVLAGGLYWYFSSGTGEQPTLSVSTSETTAEQTFQTLVNQLGPISFDTSILSDPRFNALVNITAPITPEPTGRQDPFAPISGTQKTGQ